jgi:hypothetical protein
MVEHPATVYNAAKAADLAAFNTQAIELYEKYISDYPDEDKVEMVTARLKELKEQERARREEELIPVDDSTPASDEKAVATEEAPTSQPAPEPVPKKPTSDNGPKLAVPGYIALGLGGAGLLTGLTLQILAGIAQDKGRDTTSPVVFEDAKDDMETYQTGALVGFIAGGATLLTGVVLVMVDYRKRDVSRARLSLSPSPMGLELRGKF